MGQSLATTTTSASTESKEVKTMDAAMAAKLSDNIGALARSINTPAALHRWIRSTVSVERIAALFNSTNGSITAEQLQTTLSQIIKIVFRRIDSNGNGKIDDHEMNGLVAVLIQDEDFSVLTRDYLESLKGLSASYIKLKGDSADHFVEGVIALLAGHTTSKDSVLPVALANLLPMNSIGADEWMVATGSATLIALSAEEEMQAKIKAAMEAALKAERDAKQRQQTQSAAAAAATPAVVPVVPVGHRMRMTPERLEPRNRSRSPPVLRPEMLRPEMIRPIRPELAPIPTPEMAPPLMTPEPLITPEMEIMRPEPIDRAPAKSGGLLSSIAGFFGSSPAKRSSSPAARRS